MKMMKMQSPLLLAGVAMLALLCPTGFGQAPQAFTVVSIKPLQQLGGTIDGYTLSGPNLVLTAYEISGIIREAYDLKTYQLVLPEAAGKDLGRTYWNIWAVAPEDRVWTRAEVRPLLQAMLADRFHLAVHAENRELPAYALTVGPKGPNFKPGDASQNCQISGGVVIRGVVQSLKLTDCPLQTFADELGKGQLDRRVVLDRTGLNGVYSFTYIATPNFMLRGPAGNNPAAIDPKGAVKALGLKLEAITAPVHVLVVDRVDRPSADQ